jgi:hypothetical protein
MENTTNTPQESKPHKMVGYVSTFLKSAAVALIFALVCFAFDRYENVMQQKQLDESIAKLDEIEQSLSTRSLGIFPGYIKEIRELFNNINKTDTIVIMEDVLYYGFKSKPKEFYEMNKKLFDHAMQKGAVTVAYYSFEQRNVPVAMDIFHNMIKNEHISSDNIAMMNKECDTIIRTIKGDNKLQKIWAAEYELCDKYFKATIKKDYKKFEESINGENGYLSTALINFGENETTQGAGVAKDMCKDIQKLKEKYLKKDLNKITFADFENMNREISMVIAEYYEKRGIKLVPLNEYLTMSCWMVKYGHTTGAKAVLAFPSKYSSDEIGFYSQDEAFSRYISTMLNGILLNKGSEANNY